MRGLSEGWAEGALAPSVAPLPGTPALIIGRIIDRPGMFLEPKIERAEPGLDAGAWVEFVSVPGLTCSNFIHLRGLLIPPWAL